MMCQDAAPHVDLLLVDAAPDEAETRELIYEIYDRILAGEAFENLARQYSEDTGSALAGGDLGWAESGSFSPEFAAAMDNAEIDVPVEPFQSGAGWHVLEVQERRDHDMSEEAMRNMALRILHNRRFEEELENWLGEIRDEAYVEIRLDSAPSDTPSEDVVVEEG